MIVFLTLAYVALLSLLVKLHVVRLNLAWKLSPVVWFLLLNIVLFIPMQWGAPSGPVGVFRNAIEIVPAVGGQVVDVSVTPLSDVKGGDVLFQIDPRPFQAEVDRLTAALEDAKQQPGLLQASVDIAEAAVERAAAERERARRKVARSKPLVESGAVTQEEYEQDLRTAIVADRAEEEAEARLTQAKLEQASVTRDGENTTIAQAREALDRAMYDLEQATVRAPYDGQVQQLALSPGTRVAAMPLRGAMVFVEEGRSRVVVAIKQNQLRHVRIDQPAEVVLKLLPGKTLSAKVVGIAKLTSGGQVRFSGVVEDLTSKLKRDEPYQVVLELMDPRVQANGLPGGAVGTAAIYTDQVRFTHIIRRVMLRMQAWIDYVL